MMPFWKKAIARSILNNLLLRVENLSKPHDKKRKIIATLKEIYDSIDAAKAEILERAEEEKAKPWIAPRFDPEIDAMANRENEELERLRETIKFYIELSEEAKEEKNLQDVLDNMVSEEKAIRVREAWIKETITKMEVTTLAERLRGTTAPAMTKRTRDGASWSNIAYVARQLGGSTMRAGEHTYYIGFPGAARRIPLSADIYSTIIADEVKKQLKFSLPRHKIPSSDSLVKAFKRGNISAAA